MVEILNTLVLVLTVSVIYLLFRERTKNTVIAIVVVTMVLAILDGILGDIFFAFIWLGGSFFWYLGYQKMWGNKEENKKIE
jgi:hypothetical protein